MDPCAVRLKYLIAARTPSAIACVESRNVTADPSRGRGMSPNRVWLSMYIAVYVAETHWRCWRAPACQGELSPLVHSKSA
jgi:hypothetical protein